MITKGKKQSDIKLSIRTLMELHGVQKITSNALRVERYDLTQKVVDNFRNMSQAERESRFTRNSYVDIHENKLNEIMLSDLIQKLIKSNILGNIDVDEKYLLLETIIIDLGMKSLERELGMDEYEIREDKRDLSILEVPEYPDKEKKKYLISIQLGIDTLYSDSTVLRIVKKILGISDIKRRDDLVRIKTKILDIIYSLDSFEHDIKIIELTFREYKLKGDDSDEYIVMKRIEVQYTLAQQLILEGYFSSYPLPSIEPLQNYTQNSHKNDYMLKNGLMQPKACLDVLNTLQNHSFKISEGIDVARYRGKMLEEYTKEKGHAEAEFITSIRIGSLQQRLDIMYGSTFYIAAKYDKRGRINRVAHLLNPQGSEYEKSTLGIPELVVKDRELNKENYAMIEKNIYISIAMLHGYDKEPFSKREEIGRKNYEARTNSLDSDSYPWIYSHYKALENMQHGKYPNVAIGLDATNQALQLYAVLTGDLTTAKTCNVASGNIRTDAYKMLAESLNKEMNTNKFNRDNCKKALMITMYGSGSGHEEIIKFMYMKNGDFNQAKEAFCIDLGLGTNIVQYGMLEDFEGIVQLIIAIKRALSIIAPKAMETMKRILEVNVQLAKREYYWTMPDGFNSTSHSKINVNYAIFAKPTRYKKDKEKLEIIYNDELFGANKKSRALPANIIQSVDGYVCREMVRRMNGRYIMTIHDAFYCLPEDMNLMIQNYKNIMCELLDSNLLNDILSEICGKNVTLDKNNGLTKEYIQNSDFILS